MILTSKYIDDDNHVKYAPITTPNAVRWPDGSNLNDKLGSISYNDLTDKPTIPDAQIQSDWNQSDNTQKDFIKNKPTIPAAQVQSDWNASTGMGVILNKPTIPTVPTNVSAFTNDAGYLTGHQDISGKEDKMVVVTQSSGTTLTAAVGNYYRFTYDVGTLDITLPTPTGSNAQSVLFFMTTGASPAVTFTSTGNTIYKNDGFAIAASTTYEINALWNGQYWVINTVKYTT